MNAGMTKYASMPAMFASNPVLDFSDTGNAIPILQINPTAPAGPDGACGYSVGTF
jgi:hypothetical protein